MLADFCLLVVLRSIDSLVLLFCISAVSDFCGVLSLYMVFGDYFSFVDGWAYYLALFLYFWLVDMCCETYFFMCGLVKVVTGICWVCSFVLVGSS